MIYVSLFPYSLGQGTATRAGSMGAFGPPTELAAMALRHGVVDRLCLIHSGIPIQKQTVEQQAAEQTIRELQEEFGRNQVQVRSFQDLPTLLADPRHLFVERAALCPALLQTRNASFAPVATCGLIDSIFAPDMLQTWISLHFLPQPQDAFVVPCASARQTMEELLQQTGRLIATRAGSGNSSSAIRLETIPFALDASAFEGPTKESARQLLEVDPERTVLLWLGRLSEGNQADLLPLLQAVAWAQPNELNLHLLLAGDCSDPNFPARLMKTATSLGIGHRLSLFAEVSPAGKSALLSAADIFISPEDSIQESYGLPLLEAMAAGLPVVASSWGGYRDVVEDGVTGLLVPTLWNPMTGRLTNWIAPLTISPATEIAAAQMTVVDVTALSQAIVRLARNRDLRLRMGASGRERVKTHFSWKTVMPRFAELWKGQQDEVRARPRIAGSDGFLDLDGLFGPYAPTTLDPTMEVQRTASGQASLANGMAEQEPRHSHLNHGKVLELATEPITIAALSQCLDMDALEAVGYLLKTGALRIHFKSSSSPKTTSSPVSRTLPTTRVLIVSLEFGETVNGGIGACLNSLYPELSKLIELHVARLWWNNSLNCFSAEFFGANSGGGGSSGNYLKDIIDHIENHKITHVHVHHGTPEIADLIKLLTLKVPHVRLVYTCHSIFKHEEKIRDVPDIWLKSEAFILKSSHVFHVLNNVSKNWLLEQHGDSTHSKQVEVIPNGYDALLLAHEWRRPAHPVITCIGRWAPGKGLEHFLQSRRLILESFPDAQFHIGGRDPNVWADQVKRYTARIDHMIAQDGAATTIHAWMPLQESWSLLAHSSVVVMPSELEYCPYSFIEPCVIGVPVVTSALPVIEEMVHPTHLLETFLPGDPKALADAVLATFRHPASRQRATDLRELILSRHSWSSLAPRYLQLYLQH